MSTFASLGLSEPIESVLSKQGITEPFPIQAAAVPPALAGRDIKGRAPTGSGKTLAFGLPLMSRVSDAKSRRPRALVLAPTRELAEQIRRDLSPVAEASGRTITAIFGGVGYGPQRKALNRGVDVLVATPGRLEDLIDQGSVDLSEVDIVVLDEADRMADMGFLPAMRRILDQTSSERQTLLFSATLDGDVAVLSRKYQNDPVTVSAEATEEEQFDLEHRFWRVDRAERVHHTARIIAEADRTIVFTRTRHGADRLVKQLGRAGVSAVAMHGGKSQNQRTRALRAFTKGNTQALIATDVAARGIHVPDVDVVVHFDPAGDHKDYVHRSGRTARAGATGVVISLVDKSQIKDIKKMQKALDLDEAISAPDQQPKADKARRADVPTRARAPKRESEHHSRPSRGRSKPEPSRSIFVGNLAWRSTADDLERLFAEHGQVVNATISTRGNSGKSKGYGFVEMPESDSRAAIDALNGSKLAGRPIKVRPAR